MDFTFGICVSEENIGFHDEIIDSIRALKIPNSEIVFIGDIRCDNTKVDVFIPFDESLRTGWITAKKNVITSFANFENIVFLHDYIRFDKNWYKEFLDFGNNFNVCMNRVVNLDGKRNLDWFIDYQILTLPNAEQLLPYSNTQRYSKMMYLPGFYWIAKKHVMEEFPLNEDLCWGQAEDVEWSRRVSQKYTFSMNPKSEVQFMKQKSYTLNEMSPESLDMVNKFGGQHASA